MGRWSQRRMRGGGGSHAAPPPPISITGVTVGLFSTALVQFSAPVTLNLAAFPDGAFSGPAGGGAPTTISQPAADQAQVSFSGTVMVGDPWTLTAQPNWCVSALAFPDSGTVA